MVVPFDLRGVSAAISFGCGTVNGSSSGSGLRSEGRTGEESKEREGDEFNSVGTSEVVDAGEGGMGDGDRSQPSGLLLFKGVTEAMLAACGYWLRDCESGSLI